MDQTDFIISNELSEKFKKSNDTEMNLLENIDESEDIVEKELSKKKDSKWEAVVVICSAALFFPSVVMLMFGFLSSMAIPETNNTSLCPNANITSISSEACKLVDLYREFSGYILASIMLLLPWITLISFALYYNKLFKKRYGYVKFKHSLYPMAVTTPLVLIAFVSFIACQIIGSAFFYFKKPLNFFTFSIGASLLLTIIMCISPFCFVFFYKFKKSKKKEKKTII